MYRDFFLKDIENSAHVIVWNENDGHFFYDDNDFKDCILILDNSPPDDIKNDILNTIGKLSRKTSEVEIPFDKILPSKEKWWKSSSEKEIKVPIGKIRNENHYFEIGQGSTHHCLVAGMIGSGKSYLLHVLITALGLIYSPFEIELYLIDFKPKGNEFRTYAENNMPHAQIIGLESDREFAFNVIKKLDEEFESRANLFGNEGVANITKYRKKVKEQTTNHQKEEKQMSRILLIVDEFQELFAEDDFMSEEISKILDKIIKMGRAYGIHIILCTQTLAGLKNSYMRKAIGQIMVRIALKCSDEDSSLILADDNKAASQLPWTRMAIYNDNNGFANSNQLFQMAWLPDEIRDVYLQYISNEAKNHYVIPQPTVFEGYKFADIKKNQKLIDLLTSFPKNEQSNHVSACLGDPIEIKEEPTTVYFNNEQKNNLLIIGRDYETSASMIFSSLITLASQHKQNEISFYIVNLFGIQNIFTRCLEIIPHPIKLYQDFSFLDEIVGNNGKNMKIDQNGKSIYIVFFGLQRAKYLYEDESSFQLSEDIKMGDPRRQFSTLLKEGPEVGIHSMVWCDSYSNIKYFINEFNMRIALQISKDDSYDLIGSYDANELKKYKAINYDKIEGKIEKFRPYSFPEEEWLEWIKEQFNKI